MWLFAERDGKINETGNMGGLEMPELSRFGGIVVKMLFNDTVQHNKPHVHV